MAGTVPKDPHQTVAFMEAHADLWVEHATSLGLSNEQTAAALAELIAARDARHEAERARLAAQNATRAFRAAARRLFERSAPLVTFIRAHAEETNDAGVYARAGIDPPRSSRPHTTTRTPKLSSDAPRAPQPPNRVTARLVPSTGHLEIQWHAPQPCGTRHAAVRLTRSLDRGPFTFLAETGAAITGSKTSRGTFTDTTIPPGTRVVEYILTPVRGKHTGRPSEVFTVRLGAAGTTPARRNRVA